MGRPRKAEPTAGIRIPVSFLKRIRRVAIHKDQDPGDYLAERFGPLLEEDEREILADLKAELGRAKKR